LPVFQRVEYNIKALRKTEISELFVFESFRKVCFSKVRNFSKIAVFLELAKILRKKYKMNFVFWGQKVLKSSELVPKKFGNRGFRTFIIYGKFGICSIPNFPKITKK
jgi:hypothetical protein